MKRISFHRSAVAVAVLLSLAACGGGGGGDASPSASSGSAGATGGTGTSGSTGANTSTTTALQAQLGGVAATGAAFAGATVVVTDQTGNPVCTTQTDAKGAYACTLPAGVKAPLVIKASREDAALYSTLVSGGVANITPLTTIVAAQLSPDGNPASLAKAVVSRADLVTSATLDQEVKALLTTLQPLLSALGLATLDPISGTLVADGTGHDKVLDAISVSVRPDGTAANIEITVKAQPSAADAAPLSVVIRTDATSVPVLPAVTATQLAAVVSPTMVADLFSRITACYALPASQRVRNGNDTGSVSGTGADVLASACRTLFLGDDPASYVSNGNTVGGGAFTSLFRGSSTGLKWERGNLEFVRSNGDLVLSYRWTDAAGNSDNDTLVARNVNGALKLTGNGYRYSATVRPYSEDRTLINTPAFSSFTTGYNISIANRLDAQGSSLFSKVVVTTPFNTQLTYQPSPGLSSLVLVNAAGTLSGTPVYRLAAAYQNTATAGNPVDKETGFVIASPQYDEAALRAIKDQSVWTLEFFHANTQTANVVQSYRTLSRAQTIGEIKQITFVDATAALRRELIAETGASASGNLVFGPLDPREPNIIDFSADGDTDGWTVPDGALAPTSLIAYGRAPTVNGVQGTRYNDSINVPSTARKAKIYCSPATVSDPHCAPAATGQYAQGTTLNMFELWARNKSQVEISKKIATYKLQ